MNRRELFDLMLETARRVFDRVELAAGDFHGGACKVRDEQCLMLNRAATLDANLRILASQLAKNDLNDIFLVPKVREAIDRYSEV